MALLAAFCRACRSPEDGAVGLAAHGPLREPGTRAPLLSYR